ncbi:ShlB/FhaC/HecB family hemolysin secretion/activation protein [Halieaceae bacterium IMCC14734]|uniref:ShlB/FhaC/HecB family hemolysin secretion/activation protein n=1 Tax=Candidatus Litorirhabdus singularis TaxID=2518993 RepID=A0ABT3TM51_9GAMM|nr:ShlB/FhaC/HecB family hemolysin secretion/activation protein [Candidatus Litorirhabdus singularis]MCX2983412.1 ShlB/FhaC/HecB family hemolysin secretion/activation protein [Candidatus Litorirhabdus singularis]
MSKIAFASLALVLATLTVYSSGSWAQAAELERSRQIREAREQERRLQEELERRRSAEDEPVIVDQEQMKDQPVPEGGEAVKVTVTEFVTGDSDILSSAELAQILDPLKGKTVTLAELFQAVDRINALYKEKGFLAAKALLPPQTVKGGVVKIQLVEGRVGSIVVEGNAYTRDSVVISRIQNRPGELVQLDQLEESLSDFNIINNVALRATIKPGETVGTTDYFIQVQEPKRQQGLFFADNSGTDDIGEYRVGFNYSNNGLLGYLDRFTLGFHAAEGTLSGFSAYDFPINTLGTRMSLLYDISAIEIIDGDLEDLNVEGDSWNAGAEIRHPFIVDPDMIVNGFATYYYKSSSTEFDGVQLFDTTVKTLSAGGDVQAFTANGSWYMQHTLTFIDGEDLLENDDYFRYNLRANWLHLFANSHSMSVRFSGQASQDDLLPSSEQFQIGGAYTVRGYDEGLLRGDQGYTLSMEYDLPLPFLQSAVGNDPFAGRWRLFTFLDHGGVFPYKGNNKGTNSDDFLTSLGGGITINLSERLRGRLSLGVPLFSRDDGEDDPSLHFYLETVAF